MRKPRDYESELKSLSVKARQLQQRRVQQLGELVIATGAGALPIEALAGVLIDAAEAKLAAREAWAVKGEAFFRGGERGLARVPAHKPGITPDNGDAPPPGSEPRT